MPRGDVEALVAEVNARHGTDLRIVKRYAGGERGAFRVLDAAGRAFVLKRNPPGFAPATARALGVVGYPVPRYLFAGDDYSVQEELPGVPLEPWQPVEDVVLTRLVELNELQAGRAVAEPRDWPRRLAESIGGREAAYVFPELVEAHSADGRRLVERCRAAIDRYAGDSRERDDVVHWDFTPSNVLVEDGAVTGVIDWDATTAGDRLFDVATFLFYVPTAARLRTYIVERRGGGVLSAFLAHICVRQTGWSLRYHGRETGERMLRYSLGLADDFPR